MKYYLPEGRIYNTLEEVLATGESFVAATDDHEMAMFIDWEEWDNEDKANLYAVAELSPEQQELKFIIDYGEENVDLDEEEVQMHLEDALLTIMNWNIKHTPDSDTR